MIRYEGFNPIIYKLIPPNSHVLDVGCATGELGRLLKKNKGCSVVGVEINEESGNTAKTKLLKVYIGSADNQRVLGLIKRGGLFDVIVFADILEHMVFPERMLKIYKVFLKKKARLFVSLPNIAFIYYRIIHLLGKFDYKEYGVMDKTHLRFFTLKTAKQLFHSANFKIERIIGYNGVRKRYAWLKPLGRLWPSLWATDLVFVLKPTNKRL